MTETDACMNSKILQGQSVEVKWETEIVKRKKQVYSGFF